VYQDRLDEALEAVALIHGNDVKKDIVTFVQFQETTDTIGSGKVESSLGMTAVSKTAPNRKRLMLSLSVAVFTMFSGGDLRHRISTQAKLMMAVVQATASFRSTLVLCSMVQV